jgi:hypothetical protein
MRSARTKTTPPRDAAPGDARENEAPDLPSQLEDILHGVWRAEANWRLDDRIDLATRTTRPR